MDWGRGVRQLGEIGDVSNSLTGIHFQASNLKTVYFFQLKTEIKGEENDELQWEIKYLSNKNMTKGSEDDRPRRLLSFDMPL